jgi:hypothetical protein
VFPNKGIAIHQEVGDALVWLNMDPKHRRSTGSLRGECPVLWGEKLSLTIWARSKGQEFRYQCSLRKSQAFPLDPLISPKLNMESLLLYELDVLMRMFIDEDEL